MRVAAIRPDEPDRLAALADYDALHAGLDSRLDELTALARQLLDVPIALVSLVADDRQMFVARAGLDVCETARDVSFCAHALGRDDSLIVPDARRDPRFADNPLVTGAPFVRFYAGVPLRSPGGQDIGAFCVVDTRARAGLSGRDRKVLRDLARLAMDLLEARRLDVAGRVGHARFLAIAATSPEAVLCMDRTGRIRFWNDGAIRLLGYAEAEAIGLTLSDIVPKAAGAGALADPAGGPLMLEARHRDGRAVPIELSSSRWREGGEILIGAIIRDRGERRRAPVRPGGPMLLTDRAALLARIAETMAAGRPCHLLMLAPDPGVADGEGAAVAPDAVLAEAARRIIACIGDAAPVTRLDDAFAILLDVADGAAARTVAARLAAALATPPAGGDPAWPIGVRMGIAAGPGDAASAGDLLAAAAAMLDGAWPVAGRLCA